MHFFGLATLEEGTVCKTAYFRICKGFFSAPQRSKIESLTGQSHHKVTCYKRPHHWRLLKFGFQIDLPLKKKKQKPRTNHFTTLYSCCLKPPPAPSWQICTKLQINADIIWRSWNHCTYSSLSTGNRGLKLHLMLTIATALKVWTEILSHWCSKKPRAFVLLTLIMGWQIYRRRAFVLSHAGLRQHSPIFCDEVCVTESFPLLLLLEPSLPFLYYPPL